MDLYEYWYHNVFESRKYYSVDEIYDLFEEYVIEISQESESEASREALTR